MPWIKRNLYFVITIVVGLGLAGYCGYLLLSALDQNKADSGKYASDKSNLDSLQKKSPAPNAENIHAAEVDTERVGTFLNEFRKPFVDFPEPTKLDDRRFKEFLQNSIVQFTLEATNAGVGLPPGYSFSFSQQINVLNYSSDSIVPWMQQLMEIKAILHILYAAKINYMEKIERPVVAGEDLSGGDYMQVGISTNTWGVVTPYMVNFRGFSAEIANVLAGVAASSNCLIVKTIYVQPSTVPLPQLIDLQQPEAAPAPQYRYRPPPASSFNNPFNQQPGPRGNRGGERRDRMPSQMQYVPVNPEMPVVPAGPVAVVSETPLFVTLYIDVIKLKAAEKPVPASEPSARPSRRGGR